MLNIFLVVIGAALLYFGGDLLVSNASKLARTFGLAPYVVGLTVVAFGTSSPELAATLSSSLQGASDMALGNVVGSNIANIGLILGLTALVYPLATGHLTVHRELPLMLSVSLLLWPVVQGGISRPEGGGLLALLGAYIIFQLRQPTPKSDKPDEVEDGEEDGSLGKQLLGAALGIVLLVGGAQALVTGATSIAHAAGISERVIGLTMLALGTSLPELASSLVAAAKRETEMILGGIIGSNVFNILAILGISALVRPLPVDTISATGDVMVMLGFSVGLLVLMWRTQRLGKIGGSVLLLAYTAYIVSLF